MTARDRDEPPPGGSRRCVCGRDRRLPDRRHCWCSRVGGLLLVASLVTASVLLAYQVQG